MLVSAIMPTADRPGFVPLALECFRRQTWPEKELVVLDTGVRPVGYLCCGLPGVRYFRLTLEATLGELRNLAVEMAEGKTLIHWDDDDWSAPERMADQVRRLNVSGKSVTGYSRIFYWDALQQQAYRYLYTGAGPYACGTSQCYRRAWALGHHFPDKNYGEDTDFARVAALAGELTSVDGGQMMVALSHAQSARRHPFGHRRSFPPVAREELPAAFFQDIGFSCAEAPGVRPEQELKASGPRDWGLGISRLRKKVAKLSF